MAEQFQQERELRNPSISALWRDENGQDLIEYTLLMAFVALVSASLFASSGSSVSKIWSSSSTTLSKAVTAAS